MTVSLERSDKVTFMLVSPCSYVNYVRIRDALNRTRTAYSDGVTVLIRRPDTASVRDGLADNDIDFQQPVDTLSANWDSFGDSRSTLPSDRIIRLRNTFSQRLSPSVSAV